MYLRITLGQPTMIRFYCLAGVACLQMACRHRLAEIALPMSWHICLFCAELLVVPFLGPSPTDKYDNHRRHVLLACGRGCLFYRSKAAMPWDPGLGCVGGAAHMVWRAVQGERTGGRII